MKKLIALALCAGLLTFTAGCPSPDSGKPAGTGGSKTPKATDTGKGKDDKMKDGASTGDSGKGKDDKGDSGKGKDDKGDSGKGKDDKGKTPPSAPAAPAPK